MKKLYIITCLGLSFLTGCDDFVENEYPTNQIGTVQVFEDRTTAISALGNLYARLRDKSILSGGDYVGAGSLLDSYSDNLDCYYFDENGVVDIYTNQQQETNSVVGDVWSLSYEQIYFANSVIKGVENSKALSDADKNSIIGEALLIRSMLYFYLGQLFGDVPYTESLDYEHNRTLDKLEYDKLMEQLESSLLKSIDLLQDDYRDAERIYPNQKVAELMLAKVYLTEQKFELAAQMAEKILVSPLYEFQWNLDEVFHNSGRHILWQLKPQSNGDAVEDVLFYYFMDSAPYSYVLSQDLMNTFEEGDLRKQSWTTSVTFGDQSWYRPNKYKNLPGENNNEDLVVFRLAEVCFIMAEALAKQNRFIEALPYLNATRERAGLPILLAPLSGDSFYNELYVEKRREFFTESGHRFLDLKRWGQLHVLSAVKSNWEEYKSIWPLPQSELLLNDNLYPQNPGY